MKSRQRCASFTALDFETANHYRNSACAIGLVRVEGGEVVERAYHLMRPPFSYFSFTDIHGIDWPMVEGKQTFAELWHQLAPFFEGVEFVAAHNASFDKSVLRACCDWYGVPMPSTRFECTVKLARATWSLRPTTLPDVADFLGLSLNHHDAESDAEVCASIVLSAMQA